MLEKPVKSYKRTQYLVAKKFQLKYVGLILLLVFATAALCAYIVYYTSMLLMGEKLANVYPQGRLVSIVKIINFRIFLSLILVTPLVAMIGIFLSHRIAGPIYRMEKFLVNAASGDLNSHIILRAKDELISLANGINLLIDSVKTSVNEQRSRLKRAAAGLGNIKKDSEEKPVDISAIKEGISKLDGELAGLSKELSKYKL